MIKIVNDENVNTLANEEQILYKFFNENTNLYKCYTDFPILKGGIYDDVFKIDLCFNTSRGIFCFNKLDISSYDDICAYQDELYSLFEVTLKKVPIMTSKRKLITSIHIITLDEFITNDNVSDDYLVFNNVDTMISSLKRYIRDCEEVNEQNMKVVNSSIQGSYGTITRKKRDFEIGTKSEIIASLNDCIEEYDDSQFNAIFSNMGIQ